MDLKWSRWTKAPVGRAGFGGDKRGRHWRRTLAPLERADGGAGSSHCLSCRNAADVVWNLSRRARSPVYPMYTRCRGAMAPLETYAGASIDARGYPKESCGRRCRDVRAPLDAW